MKGNLYLIAIILIHTCYVRADLPVHCLKHQVVGQWEFSLDSGQAYNRMEKMHLCGHELPDNAETSDRDQRLNVIQKYLVTLQRDNTAKVEDSSDNGHWTMIYDEGFEVDVDDMNYFAFSKFYKEDGQMKSECSKTLKGWYHDTKNNKMGCFIGEKTDGSSQVNDEVKHEYVVQPKEYQSFLQQSDDEINYFHKDFKDHHETVDRLNNAGNLWIAKYHDEHVGKTLAQLNKRAGHRRSWGDVFVQGKSETKSRKQKYPGEYEIDDVSDLPTEFTWKDKLDEVREQGDCGSCYVFATMQMLQARLKIHHGDNVRLSVQHAVDCDVYNQGCDGGYPFLVEKFASEYDLVPESCNEYQGKTTGYCERCKVDKLERTYRVDDFYFVGGAYGKASERNIMLEVKNNGPIAASFEPGYDFMFYNEGIYHAPEMTDWVNKGEAQPEWEKVDHSVLLYGWGETLDGEKYWELQNTWGKNWGEEGFFRMRRGVDDSAIESLAEAAMPKVIERQFKHANIYSQTSSYNYGFHNFLTQNGKYH